MCVRPCFQAELRFFAYVLRRQVRPFCWLIRFKLNITQEVCEGGALVALRQASNEPGFDISAGQDDRGKAALLNMSQELSARWVPRESGGSRTEFADTR
jgi:hypothetical protein